MMIKYGIDVDKTAIIKNLDRITNQIYKLLPVREEGGEWIPALENILIELTGINRLLIDQVTFFTLLSKLEGLFILTEENDFLKFRKTIFECLSMMNKVKECLD